MKQRKNSLSVLRSPQNLVSALIGVTIFVLGHFVRFDGRVIYFFWSAGAVLFCCITTFRLFSKRAFFLANLSLFLTYGVTVVWLFNFALQLPMSSWRAGWEGSVDFPVALGLAILYLTWFSLLANGALAFMSPRPIGPLSQMPRSFNLPVLVLAVTSGVALLIVAGQARDAFLLSAGVGSMFVVQAASVMSAVLFAAALFFMSRGVLRSVVIAVLLGTAFVVGANGFRFILVIYAMLWGFHTLATRRLSAREGIAVGVAGLVAYLFMLIIAYTRSQGMAFGEAVAFALHPDLQKATSYVGGSDQANVITLNFYYWRHGMLMGETYLDAILNLTPNIIHETYFSTIRPQDYIIETGSFIPDVFRQNNWTMGAHIFVEAIINFGHVGPYLVLSALVPIIAFVEANARRSQALFLGYIVMAAMAYSLAWYGFANALKQDVFALACGFATIWIGQLAGKPGIKRRLPGSRMTSRRSL